MGDAVRRLVDAINDRRLDRLGDALAAHVVDHNKIVYGERDEPGAAFDGFAAQLAAFDPLRVQLAQLLVAGDQVAARLMVRGRHTGAHPRMPQPTGADFEIEQIWWFTVRDDRITEIRAVADRLGMFSQLGWDWPTRD